MAGIYFHIPFCKVKCSYCDFYKSTNTRQIDELIRALKLELWLRRDYLKNKIIETIYFGGGTPSLLTPLQLKDLITTCYSVFQIAKDPEITIEANPDDITLDYLKAIKSIRVNRISLGIQSLSDVDLKLMNRRHDPTQAINAIMASKQAGFNNISVDLIYGLPGMSFHQWQQNLKKILSFNIQHISAYHLTYHEKTRLGNDLKKGLVKEIDEGESLKQFDELLTVAHRNNFIQYEISNFALEGFISKHNSSYWMQTEYLGLGPSAHSYNKVSRQWNVSSLTHYLLALNHRKIPFENEILTLNDRFNDYVITSLRTMWGIDLAFVIREFGMLFSIHLEKVSNKYFATNQLVMKNNHLVLDKKGMFISDTIISDFMI